MLQIPGYTVISYLGKGAFGAALLVERNYDKRQFAAKQIALTSDQDREDAKKEAEVLKSLSSNFIVRYTDFSIVQHSCCYIVMEFCDGGDLRGKINLFRENKKPIDDSLVVIWMAQVGMALSYCHNRNLLHRDLKPENIFLMKDGVTCKLGDFGVAKALATTNAMTGTMNIGTPMNFCPELFNSQPYSNSADIWAFGCALFEAKFFYHPMAPQDGSPLNYATLMNTVLSGNYPRKSCEIGQVVNKCLHLNPQNRPSIADILNHPKFAPVTRKLENGILPVNISREGAPVNKKQEEVMSELSKFLQNKKYHDSESDRIDRMVDQLTALESRLEADENLCVRIFSEAQREIDIFQKARQEFKSEGNGDPNLRPFDQQHGPLSPYLLSLSANDQRSFMDFNGRRERVKEAIELKRKIEQEFIFYNNRAKMLKDHDIRVKTLIEQLGRESTDPETAEILMAQLHSDAWDKLTETVRNLPVLPDPVRPIQIIPDYISPNQSANKSGKKFPYRYFALPIHSQGSVANIIGTRFVVFKNAEVSAQLDVINGEPSKRGRKGDPGTERFLTKRTLENILSSITGNPDGVREMNRDDFDVEWQKNGGKVRNRNQV